MGGEGNGEAVIAAANQIIQSDQWCKHFKNFNFRYAFYRPEEYREWLEEAGLNPIRVELIPKDMIHENRDVFAGWLGSVFHPYSERVPETNREQFIKEIVENYLEGHPVDDKGQTHLRMVRLEVEAEIEK